MSNLYYAYKRHALAKSLPTIVGILLGGYLLPTLVLVGCGTLMVGATLYGGSVLAGIGLFFYLAWQTETDVPTSNS